VERFQVLVPIHCKRRFDRQAMVDCVAQYRVEPALRFAGRLSLIACKVGVYLQCLQDGMVVAENPALNLNRSLR
jgi:hypothetical protein